MGLGEELIKNKEELLLKLLEVLGGKETNVKVNLDGIKLKIGNLEVQLKGDVEFTLVPPKEKKK